MAARIERIGATHPWLVAESDGAVVGFAYACEHRSRRGLPLGGRRLGLRRRRGRPRPGTGRGLYVELFERLREQRFRVACAGDHAAERGQRRPPRGPRLRAGRRLPPDRLEAWRLARRRLVAARAQPGRRQTRPSEPLARPRPNIGPCPRTRQTMTDRGRRTRGARGGHRPRARPRLRLARPRLRRRDREARTSTSPSP